MSPGNVYHAVRDGTCVLRFQGAINYTLGPALDRFLDQLFAGGDFRTILVDLSLTESIDSTGLGLLARVAKFMRQRDGLKPLLFSTDADINQLLRSICMDDFFVLCEQAPDGQVDTGTALPVGEASERELAKTVLAAHRLLCEMNDNNRALFQNVVEAIEQDLGPT